MTQPLIFFAKHNTNVDINICAHTLIPINTRETHTEVDAYVKAHNSLL